MGADRACADCAVADKAWLAEWPCARELARV